MKKRYLREIHDGDDCTDIGWIIVEILGLLAIIGAIVIMTSANWTLVTKAVDPAPAVIHRADPEWEVEQRRLHRKHGEGYVIVYEADQPPYYINDRGEKCRFE